MSAIDILEILNKQSTKKDIKEQNLETLKQREKGIVQEIIE